MGFRHCSRCGLDKPVGAFKIKSDGRYNSYCSPCDKEYKRQHYLRNADKYKAKAQAWRAANREQYLANSKRYNEATSHLEKWRLYSKLPRRIEYSKRWRDNNIEKQRTAESEYRDRNRQQCNARVSQWKKLNKDRVSEYAFIRGRASRKATPSWADRAKMLSLYLEAKRLSRETGIQHHVDHIVPLISGLVCGLHCPSNMRVVPRDENLRKGNKFWPDMP